MKNTVIIVIDTDSEQPIQIGKPDTIPKPNNAEEAAAMVLNDIDCVSEALLTMIEMAHVNSYGDRQQLVGKLQAKITSYLNPIPSEHQENPQEPINRENTK